MNFTRSIVMVGTGLLIVRAVDGPGQAQSRSAPSHSALRSASNLTLGSDCHNIT